MKISKSLKGLPFEAYPLYYQKTGNYSVLGTKCPNHKEYTISRMENKEWWGEGMESAEFLPARPAEYSEAKRHSAAGTSL